MKKRHKVAKALRHKVVKKKKLRSGYTTGACAAAAAKAAMLVMRNALSVTGKDIKEKKSRITHHASRVTDVEIPFPDGSRVKFKIHNSKLITLNSKLVARASVIKDAGDDPDVTNGAEIVAGVVMRKALSVKSDKENEISKKEAFDITSRITSEIPLGHHASLLIKGGKGVGIVTKPGLPVPVGESAINPVPRRMI